MTNQTELIRQQLNQLSNIDKANFIRSLNKNELKWIQFHPDLFVKDYQLIPEGDWRYFWFRGSRFIGKTFTGTAWLATKALNGAKEVAIVGPTHKDLKKEIIPVFKSHLPKDFIKIDNQQDGFIVLKNGCTVKIYSSEYEIRGCNAEYALAEEIAKWCDMIPDKIEERWQVFNAGVRSTRIKNPQILIASTPKPFPFFINFEKQALANNPLYAMKTVTIDQAAHIPDNQKEAIKESLGATRLGRQELYAELLTDTPGALWNHDMIDKCHDFKDLPELASILQKAKSMPADFSSFNRIVVAVDPAVSKDGDETGIIVAAMAPNSISIILEDASGRYTPNEWARKVYSLFMKYGADRIIAEKNNGGDLVEVNLRTVNANLPIKLIHATKGKILRAEPVAALYEQGKVKHLHTFAELEQQMTNYTGTGSSPDHLDAAVYAITELMLSDSYTSRGGVRNINWFGY